MALCSPVECSLHRVLKPSKLYIARPCPRVGTWLRLAVPHADLGDKDHAFEWLNTAYQAHDHWALSLRTASVETA
jgi:hypothetical protein